MQDRTLGHYENLEKLGEGGMGVLYRARDTSLERIVALKVLRPEAVGDADRRRRFVQEARAASALNHPNIVTIYEINRTRDGPDAVDFISMECVEGRPLDRVIAGRPLPVAEAVGYAVQIAAALAAAHQAGIVHRDVKPANVMVTSAGHVKVLDFGLAKLTWRARAGDEDPTCTMEPRTQEGVVLGTAAYMSPEQAEGRPVDARSDVFSFGALLYEMLAGSRPFHGETRLALLSAILRAAPPPIRHGRPAVPVGLARIVERCLQKDREDRYASANDLHAELLAFRSHVMGHGGLGARRLRRLLVAALAVLVAVGGTGAWLSVRAARLRWAREVALPEIARLLGEESYVEAVRLALEAEPHLRGNAQLERLWRDVAVPASISTMPAGAEVRVQQYARTDGAWLSLGHTPLQQVRVPGHLLRWRIEKEGHEPLELALSVWNQQRFDLILVPKAEGPEGMVRIPSIEHNLATGLDAVHLEEYWLDRFEVTNRQFKQFVDAGGYRRPEYWREAFHRDGWALSWDEAKTLFRDATGRPGPSTWELGAYGEGMGDHPVSGVSWYEAAAYAVFADKSLPTVYHWLAAAGVPGPFSEILRFSNFGRRGPAAAGSYAGLARYGNYDMAGNVKEWCWNAVGPKRYLLGGAWDEPTYEFSGLDAQSPFDRSPRNGFRLARYGSPLAGVLTGPIETPYRDYAKEKPASDEVFAAYRGFYSYERSPLEAVVESVEESDLWRRERITLNAAYAGERVIVYLYLPRNAVPPYQTVAHFPGIYATRQRSSEHLEDALVTFVMMSGRALLWPIYKGTYERGGGEGRPNRADLRRDQVIQWSKDLGRSIDYLETRPDIDRERLAFYGFSTGAAFGPILTALEPRLKASVLLCGGFSQHRDAPEVQAFHFAPRAKIPVLMLNGRHDFRFPLETAQLPLFRLLGAPAQNKRHVLFDSGHAPPRMQEVIKEVLDWLDRHLGPVATGPAPPR